MSEAGSGPARRGRPEADPDSVGLLQEGILKVELVNKLSDKLKAEGNLAEEQLFCICQKPYEERSFMIGCDNEECKHGEWFHPACVGLGTKEAKEVENWTCPPCLGKDIEPPPPKKPRIYKEDDGEVSDYGKDPGEESDEENDNSNSGSDDNDAGGSEDDE